MAFDHLTQVLSLLTRVVCAPVDACEAFGAGGSMRAWGCSLYHTPLRDKVQLRVLMQRDAA